MLVLIVAVAGMACSLAVLTIALRSAAETPTRRRFSAAVGAPTQITLSVGSAKATALGTGDSRLMVAATQLGTKLARPASFTNLTRRIEQAGLDGWDAQRVMGAKVLASATGALLGVVLGMMMGALPALIVIPAATVLGWFIPNITIYQIRYKRVIAMQKAAADSIDLLCLTMSAGVSVDAALRTVADHTSGPLSQELSKANHAIAVGVARTDALKAMGERVGDQDVTRLVNALIQADKRGSGVTEILKIQAKELRLKRRQRAEETAAKIPVKILFPMMVFVLPTLGIIMMAPAVVNIMFTLGGR